jgi:peroxiredoxin
MKKYIPIVAILICSIYLMAMRSISHRTMVRPEENVVLTNYQIGDKVAYFSLPKSDGSNFDFNSGLNIKGAIIIFTSMHCPFSKAYEDRQIAMHHKYAGLGYPVIAINPSNPQLHEDDQIAKIKARINSKNYPFNYLIDADQSIAKRFGPTRIPTAYVVQKIGNQFIVKYFGMIDDNPQDANGVSRNYVEEAVSNLLDGKPVISTTTQPEGCRTRF